jgi:rubredoxin
MAVLMKNNYFIKSQLMSVEMTDAIVANSEGLPPPPPPPEKPRKPHRKQKAALQKWTCSVCGNVFEQSFTPQQLTYINSDNVRCPACNAAHKAAQERRSSTSQPRLPPSAGPSDFPVLADIPPCEDDNVPLSRVMEELQYFHIPPRMAWAIMRRLMQPITPSK